jgi:sugar phosphate isomerase/epimerase
MWALTQEKPFADFFPAAKRFGFSHQELNHQVTPEMLATVDPKSLRVDSVHEPCPCAIPRAIRKEQGIHLSSLDESLRSQAVEFVRGSLHLAHRLGATAIVVHPGEVPVGKNYEQRMRVLYAEREDNSSEYADLKERFIKERMKASPRHMEAIHRSLLELVEDAESMQIRLGLENRDHYYEIPLPEEMEDLLTIAPGVIEYWHDVGHAQKLEHLGFHSQTEWLSLFAGRMIGIHLHDIDVLTDHIVPGLGTVDWELVSSFVPTHAIRTFEVRGFTTQEQLRDAQWMLHELGCLEPYDGDE